MYITIAVLLSLRIHVLRRRVAALALHKDLLQPCEIPIPVTVRTMDVLKAVRNEWEAVCWCAHPRRTSVRTRRGQYHLGIRNA